VRLSTISPKDAIKQQPTKLLAVLKAELAKVNEKGSPISLGTSHCDLLVIITDFVQF